MKVPRRSQDGLSLVEVMLVLGIFGLLIVGVSKFSSDQMKSTKKIQNRMDLEAVKQAIRNGLSCENTLQVNPGDKVNGCRDFTMMNRQNKAFLGEDERFGTSNFFIDMTCNPQLGLFFDYNSGQDHLPLFPGEAFCTDYFRNEPAPAQKTKYQPVTCASGRVIVGIQNGVPVCGYSGGDLKGPPTCVMPASGTGAAVCTYPSPPALPTNCSMKPSEDGVLVETCQ